MLAKKSLGQHWLFDEPTLQKVIEAGEVSGKDTVLEVGPGLGTLTDLLLQKAKKVIAVEADGDLITGLKKINNSKLQLEYADIMKYDLRTLPKSYKVVANIPYYLTSNLLRMLLESSNPPTLAALLVQKEVAQRVTAKPGQMSVLAFSVQYYARPLILGLVAKELFEPAPKVDSAILQIKMRSQPCFEADKSKLFRLVKAGFGERRKQLRNSLAGGLQLSTESVSQILAQAGIDTTARAQELNMEQWQALYDQLASNL